MKKLFTLLFSAISLSATAQNISVSVSENNPDKIRPCSILFDFWDLDASKTNTSLYGMGFGFDIHVKKFMDIYLMSHFSLGETMWQKDYVGPNIKPLRKNLEELVIGFNIAHNYRERSFKVRVQSYDDGSYDYFSQDFKQRVTVCFRAGIFHFGTAYNGSDITAYTINTYGTPPVTDTNFINNYNQMDLGVIVAGFSIKFNHYGILTAGGALRREGLYREFYIDMLPLLAMKLADEYDPYDTSVVNKVYALRKEVLGYRAGFRFKPSAKSGFSFGMEIGTRPGPYNEKKNNYFRFCMGFAISFKDEKHP